MLSLSSKLIEEMLYTDNIEYHCRDCDDTHIIPCPLLLCLTCNLVYFNNICSISLLLFLSAECSFGQVCIPFDADLPLIPPSIHMSACMQQITTPFSETGSCDSSVGIVTTGFKVWLCISSGSEVSCTVFEVCHPHCVYMN